ALSALAPVTYFSDSLRKKDAVFLRDLPQELASTVNARPHRSNRRLLHIGDLSVAEALEVAHHDRVSIHVRQLLQSLLKLGTELGGIHHGLEAPEIGFVSPEVI